MKPFRFAKMVGSGNDFVVVRARDLGGRAGLARLAQDVCDRKFGIGADGMLVLGEAPGADIRMRVFNADGSEAAMCGNGARCVARWLAFERKKGKARFEIKTRAGMIPAEVDAETVRVKLTDPKGLKLDVPIRLNGRSLRVNFVNTGVPHVVIFAEGLNKIDVAGLGRLVRYHKAFAPSGANVNFLEALDVDAFKLRTYERGVEGETLACGTGSVASALIFSLKSGAPSPISAHTRSGETLRVYFRKEGMRFRDVWLEGEADIVFKGEYPFKA